MFKGNDYVSYSRGTIPHKGFVFDVQTLPSKVVRVVILEDGGGVYHIDARNVTLVTPTPSSATLSLVRTA